MYLIGYTGPMGCGKDTGFEFTKEWAEARGLTAARRGFADMLKLSAYRLFKPDCTLDEALTWCNKVKFDHTLAIASDKAYAEHRGEDWIASCTGREFLQRYGTEAHRDVFGTDFWVDALLPLGPFSTFPHGSENTTWQLNFCQDGHDPGPIAPDIAVVTDVRFENEAKRIRELSGHVVYIDRPNAQGDGHVSEQGLDPDLIDFVVPNHWGLEEYRDEIFVTLEAIHR